MSMVFCRGCAKQIHESAVSCPGCGATQSGGSATAALPDSGGNPYLKAWKNYATVQGRARRKDYWLFVLINALISVAIAMVDRATGLDPLLGLVYNLAIMIPSITYGVRRLHDTDRSGWWLLLPIVNLVFLCLNSTPGNNRFGPNPKGE